MKSLTKCQVAALLLFLITAVLAGMIIYLVYPWRHIYVLTQSCPLSQSVKVPKVVHRLWDGEVPKLYQDYLDHCQALNPEYSLRLWNTSAIEDFLRQEYPWVMGLYQSYPVNIQRYDAARYFIIYHYGGVYLDMDMNCSKSFDDITAASGTEVILGEAFPTGVVNNFFISCPRHPFFRQLTENLKNTRNESFILSVYETFLRTGPMFVWKNYINYPCKSQLTVLDKYLIRGAWLSHDGAASWQKADGLVAMLISNTWASMSAQIQIIIFLTFLLSVIILSKISRGMFQKL